MSFDLVSCSQWTTFEYENIVTLTLLTSEIIVLFVYKNRQGSNDYLIIIIECLANITYSTLM